MALVLVTRPEPGASATAQRLAMLGHQAMTAPLFTVHSMKWSAPGEIFDALMLTSANAVRLAGPLPDRWRTLPCYAVGKATAHVARQHGFANVIIGPGDAEGLATLMVADGIGSALHLAGREHHAIAATRPLIRTVVVYAADPVERLDHRTATALAAGAIDQVLLYSARAARHFAALIDAAELNRGRIALAAISPAAAKAAGDGWRSIIVAAAPAEDHLFAACGLLCDKPETA